MKRILGLDLGTNSIGWAILLAEFSNDNHYKLVNIEAAGSRIIPMDAAILGDFDRGNSISQTAERTKLRGARRLLERKILRRERLHRVLDILGFLPIHYSKELTRYGKFKPNKEPKLAWVKCENGKHKFLFVDSFLEMLKDFRVAHPQFLIKKIPYDWTIYYLRKKALTEKISKEELAWILLNFNKKRGYYQLREEDNVNKNKKVEYVALKVTKVEATNEKNGNKIWYNIYLENGWIYRRLSAIYLDWEGKIKEFIATTEIDNNGLPQKDKNGEIKRRLSAPSEDDWHLIKEKTHQDIEHSGKTVGEYIYDSILHNPNQKIKGKLIHTIERRFYKDELMKILTKQQEYHSELCDKNLYQTCIEELYSSNDAYRNNVIKRDIVYLLVEDVLFYQRPLKTKKSLIANCPYENNIVIDKMSNKEVHYGVKCIAKSNPLFQEFRLWQFIGNLRIYKKSITGDVDVTNEFLKDENDYVALFDWLNTKKTINQKTFLKYSCFSLANNTECYRWNYVEDKDYPCNETRHQIITYLKKAEIDYKKVTSTQENDLWHILYSVEDKQELIKALSKFAKKHKFEHLFVEVFQKFPPFKKEYGAYSAKAIKKMLPLMRMGKYWSSQNIDRNTLERIDKIISGEFDEKIRNRIREKSFKLKEVSSFKGLPHWLACYIVYDRHSELKDIIKWETPNDLNNYLNSFKQYSLRNPIVEQLVTETLRVVRDIWTKYGQIDEIHIELGREMKNPAEKRRRITKQISKNEITNLRIKALLLEFTNPEFEIENVRPYSPSQQEIFRIYEEGALSSTDIPDDIKNVLKKITESNIDKRPTRSEILRYKLWLEQKYLSPYTGQPISLAKLFTSSYEIEHVIPQSRYFDDSLSNKVICESEVNKLKDNYTGFEFISRHGGEKVLLSTGKTVTIFTEKEYEDFVKKHYAHNRTKMRKLMLDTIPTEFSSRQLNDSRYIGKVITGLLSNIVREKGEEDAISKNVIVCSGGITDKLKKDWGLNDVWNKIILPRFCRLNSLTNSDLFTAKTTNGHKIPILPLEFQKGFSKKRIDHRHHAMDAIVIACVNRNIINYLNNESASGCEKISRFDLRNLICDKVEVDKSGNYKWSIKKPWNTFTQDVYQTLNKTIVSIKQVQRIINKATNRYIHFENNSKVTTTQKGVNWAIRKSMHKDTVFGEVNLRKIKTISLKEAIKNPTVIVDKEFKSTLLSLLKSGCDMNGITNYFNENKEVWQELDLSKIKVYYFTKETKDRFFATRKPLDTSFTQKKIIENVTDTGAQKILLRQLELNDNNPELAFSPDGIEKMNSNMLYLNDGKFHQPIFKVRVYEKADKFAIGEKGNKSSKFVETAKGSNLYFAIYETQEKNTATGEIITRRTFATIPLNVVIDRLKQGLTPAPNDQNNNEPKFVLSPNDLVYVPEDSGGNPNYAIDYSRIYKFVSCTGNEAHFIPMFVANPIITTIELGSNNKAQRAWTNEMIKEVCVPIKVDRLGNILKIG